MKEALKSFILNLEYTWKNWLFRIAFALMLIWPVSELIVGHTVNFVFRLCDEPNIWLYALSKIALTIGLVMHRDGRKHIEAARCIAGLQHQELPYGWDDGLKKELEKFKYLAVAGGIGLLLTALSVGFTC